MASPKPVSTGKAKAAMKVSVTYNSTTKGLGLSKGSNRKLSNDLAKKSSNRDPIQKHPLVRNTGEASAEGKYRTGSKVPVKGNGAKIRTSGLQGRGGSLGGIHMGGSGMNWETK